METVELELGLAELLNNKQITCPIFMKGDPINENRYFAYHNTGLHSITFSATQQLQNFVDSSGNIFVLFSKYFITSAWFLSI